MRFLLDTHTFLWFILDSPNLSASAKTTIENAKNNRLLSVASIWEMAIKSSIGKLTFKQPFESFIPYQLRINDIELLEIKLAHYYSNSELAFLSPRPV
jgi:PIN domain nuclease of toxin-antitoxin system